MESTTGHMSVYPLSVWDLLLPSSSSDTEHSNLSIIHSHRVIFRVVLRSLRVVESTTVTHSSADWWDLLLPLA